MVCSVYVSKVLLIEKSYDLIYTRTPTKKANHSSNWSVFTSLSFINFDSLISPVSFVHLSFRVDLHLHFSRSQGIYRAPRLLTRRTFLFVEMMTSLISYSRITGQFYLIATISIHEVDIPIIVPIYMIDNHQTIR